MPKNKTVIEPHWKVQCYDPLNLCWREIPKACLSLKEAELIAGRMLSFKSRIVRVEKGKRTICT